jgi:hypothetical protein
MVPLSGYLWSVMSGQSARVEVDNMTFELCRQHNVFHWWLAFPQVAARNGFDVMLGNPPWEQLQLSEEEFFATRAPSIAALAGEKRKKAIAELEQSTPWLWNQFQTAKRQNEAASLYFRAGGRFPLTAYGKLNTYALFSETFLQATSPNGRAGFIVPTGIATDDSTKAYFEHLAMGGYLRSLMCLENEEFVFPSVHHAFRFALLTLGGKPSGESASLVFFARQPEQIHDPRRQFRLTPDEFALLNPNTRTCPVFRSQRDAELTKKLYRAAPVLIQEELRGADGQVVQPERNPWGISFMQGLFNMTSDSALFFNAPAMPGEPPRLPLYEAKMIHQFDHRWATYVTAPSSAMGDVETADVNDTQKCDAGFMARPRYWVEEREVLACIARVPARVARAWLALHATKQAPQLEKDVALADMLRGLAQWVAGELFSRNAGSPPSTASYTPAQAYVHTADTEKQLKARYELLNDVLLGEGLTTKKALTDFPKWAAQNANVRLTDDELATLAEGLRANVLLEALLELLDAWMEHRSPRWLMGWRDITGVEKIRTVIGTVVPRVASGNTMPLYFTDVPAPLHAAMLANWQSLVFDYIARQKVGGTHLTYGYLKQLPVLPPDRYTSADLNFICPRVLELTYVSHDLKPWGDDLAAHDHRPVVELSEPFAWDPVRRAQLRAELDAYYARLYGLTRDELRYILDPADVVGAEYPSETFRVLKESELRSFGEYRTRRLVLEAWDRQSAMPLRDTSVISVAPVQYSEHGVIRNADEAKFAGFIIALVEHSLGGCSVTKLQSVIARSATAAQHLEPAEGQLLAALMAKHGVTDAVSLLERVLPIVQRLEAVSVLLRQTDGAESSFKRGTGTLPGDVNQLMEHTDIARLLLTAELRRLSAERAAADDGSTALRPTGTRKGAR